MTFSATEAAFEGFRVARRAPMTVVWWSLVYFVVMAVSLLLVGPSLANLMATAEVLERSGVTNLEDVQPMMATYANLFARVLPLSLATMAILSAAVARSVLRPEQKAFGYLRLGMDEVRVLAVILVVAILFALAGGLVMGVIAGLAGVAAASGQGWVWALMILVVLGGAALHVWLAIKLSLAVPMTLDRGRIQIFASFRATKGRGWPLLGMAVIAIIMSIVVSLLGGIVGLPLTLATGGLTGLIEYDGAGLAEIIANLWPALLIWSLVNAVVSALQMAVWYAPFSAAWRDLRPA